MKKIILSTLSLLVIGSIIFLSCKSKNDTDAITPTYKEEAGTGGNPSITNVTTTGTVATTSTAYQNSTLPGIGVGGNWSLVGCALSGQTSITTSNASTNTSVTIFFSATPTAGTYQLVNSQSALTAGKAFMQITNPISQPTGTIWNSAAGSVVVTVNAPAITATFSGIVCYQTNSSFPSVTASGQVGCL